MRKLEILAPVGTSEGLIAAVRAGADAVYLGANNFNARRNAANFNDEELNAAVKYCHVRGVSVYLTLNTLILDREIEEALALVKKACEIGIDALIVADLGLIKLIRQVAPDMALHASTQMAVHTPAGIKFLAELGVKRVVLPRECSKAEIIKIALEAVKNNIELEVFVHGALCMSVSGQCYFSSVLGQRSGNRGLCAGTCRLPFTVENGTGYDLSLKDLSLIEEIKELEAIGITSLKIEGRMKRPEYIAAAVDACKKAITEGTVPVADLNRLQHIFSRGGFTKGYFKDNINEEMFGTRNKEDVINSNDVQSALHELYRNERQAVAVTMQLIVEKDKPTSLTLFDGNNMVTVKGDVPQIAMNRPLDEENAANQLKKTGGTPYYIKEFSSEIGEGLMMPASSLNALRRATVEGLDEARSIIKQIKFDETVLLKLRPRRVEKPKLIVLVRDTSQLPENLNGIDTLYLPLFTKDSDIEKLLLKGIKIGVKIPRAMFSSEKSIKTRLKEVKKLGVKTALAMNLGAIPLAKELGFEIDGGFSLNIFNSYSLGFMKSQNIQRQIVSPELALQQINTLTAEIPIGIFAYGKLPLMLLRNCPIKSNNGCGNCTGTIVDRKDVAFLLKCENGCTELFNANPIWLADRLSELSHIDFLVLEFTDETAEETEKVISAYQIGGSPPKEFTRGLYYKGVI